MPTNTKNVTWPYAIKTVAIGGISGTLATPYQYAPSPTFITTGAEIAFEIFPPQYVYQTIGLYMTLNYTFSNTIAFGDQVLQGIYVRDTPSSYVSPGFSSVENFMPLNIQAQSNTINLSLDISSLLTGLDNNVVFLRFNQNIAANVRTGGTSNGDTISLWKLELIYQTIGIRNEK